MGRRLSVGLVAIEFIGTSIVFSSVYLDGLLRTIVMVFGFGVFALGAFTSFRNEDAGGLLGAVLLGVTASSIVLVASV